MKRAFLFFIRAYQSLISPVLPPACRFYPSCSNFAYEAVTRHGPIKGVIYAIGRLLRCNPLFRGGIDLVP